MINDKISGAVEKISLISKYYKMPYSSVCPYSSSIVRGWSSYAENKYWTELVKS